MAKKKKTDILYIAGMNLLLPYDDQRTGRSSPLRYLLFRCPADNTPEGQLYRMRRESLKIRPDGMAALGIYDELLIAYGGNKIAALRGFLVNHHLRPASFAEIAQTIGCRSARTVMAVVRRLMKVGLLIQVDRPDFEEAIRKDKTIEVTPRPPCPKRDKIEHGKLDDPNDNRTDENPKREEAAVEGESQSERDKRRRERSSCLPSDSMAADADGVFRNVPAQFRKVPERFRNVPEKGGGTLNKRQETADGETPTASASPPPSADGNGTDSTDKKTASATPRPTEKPPDDVRQTDTPPGDKKPPGTDTGPQEATDTTASPTTTPPVAEAEAEAAEPTEADHQGKEETGEVFDHTTAGIDSVDVLVRDIGKTLYPTREDLVMEGRKARPPQQADEFEARERGALTVAWSAVMEVGLTPSELFQLRTRAVKEADRIRRKKTKKPKGAPWRYWFNKHMESLVGSECWAKAQRAARLDASGPPWGPPYAGQSEAQFVCENLF